MMERPKRIPDQIYLQIYGIDQRDMEDTKAVPDEITWSSDQEYDTDEMYVRHTHYGRELREKDRFVVENKRMLAALTTISQMKHQSPAPITYAARMVRDIKAEQKKNETNTH